MADGRSRDGCGVVKQGVYPRLALHRGLLQGRGACVLVSLFFAALLLPMEEGNQSREDAWQPPPRMTWWAVLFFVFLRGAVFVFLRTG